MIFFPGLFDEQKVKKKKKHLFEIEINCSIINVLLYIFDKLMHSCGIKIFNLNGSLYMHIYHLAKAVRWSYWQHKNYEDIRCCLRKPSGF